MLLTIKRDLNDRPRTEASVHAASSTNNCAKSSSSSTTTEHDRGAVPGNPGYKSVPSGRCTGEFEVRRTSSMSSTSRNGTSKTNAWLPRNIACLRNRVESSTHMRYSAEEPTIFRYDAKSKPHQPLNLSLNLQGGCSKPRNLSWPA